MPGLGGLKNHKIDLSNAPIIEWQYWNSKIDLIYINFTQFLSYGARTKYQRVMSLECYHRLYQWLLQRDIQADMLLDSAIMSNKSIPNMTQHSALMKQISQSLPAILDQALQLAKPQILPLNEEQQHALILKHTDTISNEI